MKIYIVSIGEEILEGSILDTNTHYIAKQLSNEGYKPDGFFAVGDSLKEIVELFENLTKKESIIITTGGLGPTFDDNTTLAVATVCKKKLKLNREAYFDVLKKVKAKGVKLKLSHTRQAFLPEGCKLIPNKHGTASGIFIKCENSYFISLPGVPTEMKPMFDNYCINIIKELIPKEELFRMDLKLIGVPESDMDKFIKGINTDNVQIILNAMEGELAVRLISKDRSKIEKLKQTIKDEFGYRLYSDKNETIEDVLSETLERFNLNIAFLESITAGYLSQLMYDKPSFVGSLISNKNSDIVNIFEEADIVACPCNLVGNEFDLKLRINDEKIETTLRYLGNVNFMKKAISKRTLGFIYEWLMENYE